MDIGPAGSADGPPGGDSPSGNQPKRHALLLRMPVGVEHLAGVAGKRSLFWAKFQVRCMWYLTWYSAVAINRSHSARGSC
jgi:hypothetical protein